MNERTPITPLTLVPKTPNEAMVDAMAEHPLDPRAETLGRGVRAMPFVHTPGALLMLAAISSQGVALEYVECNTIGERESAIEYLEDVLRRDDPQRAGTVAPCALAQ